jgi:hypothetical protein
MYSILTYKYKGFEKEGCEDKEKKFSVKLK